MIDILVISTVHYYKDARIFFKELKSLSKISDNLIYVAQHENKAEFTEDNVRIRPLPRAKSIFHRLFVLQIRAYKIIKELNPKVVHFHDPELIILMYFIKKRIKAKIIFDIHENVSASFNDNLWLPKFSKSFVKKYYSKIEKMIVKKFDNLIIAEKSYQATYGDEAQIIRNYPVIDDCTKINKDFLNGIRFVYSGSIRTNRGAKLMIDIIEAFSEKYNNIRFDLIGKIVPEELNDELRSYVKDKKIDNIVKFHGEIPLDKVYEVLKYCHFGFSLMDDIENYRGSLSTKIFDYMKFGVVPVVTNFEIYREFISEPNTGLLVNNEINDIVKNIDSIINNVERYNSISNNAHFNLMKHWNWELEEKKLFKIYQN